MQNTNLIDNFKVPNVKALIIENNDINNYVLSQMLLNFGIKTDIAKNEGQAVRLYKENLYDMVLVNDLTAPNVSGIETARQINQTNDNRTAPLIIGLTSVISKKIADAFNECGVEIILSKPVDYYQMATVLKREFAG